MVLNFTVVSQHKILSLLCDIILLFIGERQGYEVIWPIFGGFHKHGSFIYVTYLLSVSPARIDSVVYTMNFFT